MVRPGSHSTNPSIASISTTASSSVGSIYFLPQYMHVPDPEYISISGAISTVQEFLVEAGNAHHVLSRDIVVTPVAVQTINFFLDYILHEILARTRSTALSRLRDGVALVIRTTLGTSAMASAEQELLDHACVGEAELDENPEDGTDEDELEVKWDLDKVWARARIICMVYSILGDKEQDDFEEYEEDPDTQIPNSQKLSTAAAIYLAAVLETVASHCLRVGGRAALHRFTHHHGTTNDPMRNSALLNVDEADIKRGIVEDDLTTRLWRKWKRSENVASTILPYSVHFDAMRNGAAETLNQLPSSNSRSMSRRFSNPTVAQPAPATSTNRLSTSGERRHKHRLSRPDLTLNNDSLTEIKETLAGRGIASPESPKQPSVQGFGRESSSTRPVSYDSIRILTPPIVTAQDVEDNMPTPRPAAKVEDPLKTPTPHSVKFAADTKETAEPEAKTEEFVVGGVNGFDVFSLFQQNALTCSFRFGRPKRLLTKNSTMLGRQSRMSQRHSSMSRKSFRHPVAQAPTTQTRMSTSLTLTNSRSSAVLHHPFKTSKKAPKNQLNPPTHQYPDPPSQHPLPRRHLTSKATSSPEVGRNPKFNAPLRQSPSQRKRKRQRESQRKSQKKKARMQDLIMSTTASPTNSPNSNATRLLPPKLVSVSAT